MSRSKKQTQTQTPVGRILVADDEEIAHLTLKRLLEPEGYIIHSVYGGIEALDRAGTDFDLLILDVRMPDLDGIEVLREIRRRQYPIEVLVLTGYATLESATQALNYGARGYVMKPIENISGFKNRVHEAIHLSQLNRSNRRFYDAFMSGQLDSLESDAESHQVVALREEDKEIVQRLMEVIRDAVAFLDFDGNITFANINLAQMLGESYQRLLGARFESYLDEGDEDKIVDILTRLSSGQVAITVPARLKTSYGNRLSVIISSSPIYSEMEYRGIAMVISNVTEMNAVRGKVELLATLVENAQHDMMFIAKPDGHIMECNSLARRSFGYSNSEIAGLNMKHLFKSKGHEGWRKIKHSIERGLSWRGEILGVMKDGKEFPIEITLSKPTDNVDGIANIIVFMRDLTERKHAEQELAEARANAVRLEQLEREVRSLERFAGESDTPVTAQMFGLRPLRQGQPGAFGQLVQQYGDLMDMAIEQQTHRVDHSLPQQLQSIAQQLGFLKAAPRDVVEIHNRAFQRKREVTTPQKAQAYAEEARLILLELMGYLATYYRERSLGVWRTGTPDTDERKTEKAGRYR